MSKWVKGQLNCCSTNCGVNFDQAPIYMCFATFLRGKTILKWVLHSQECRIILHWSYILQRSNLSDPDSFTRFSLVLLWGSQDQFTHLFEVFAPYEDVQNLPSILTDMKMEMSKWVEGPVKLLLHKLWSQLWSSTTLYVFCHLSKR